MKHYVAQSINGYGKYQVGKEVEFTMFYQNMKTYKIRGKVTAVEEVLRSGGHAYIRVFLDDGHHVVVPVDHAYMKLAHNRFKKRYRDVIA